MSASVLARLVHSAWHMNVVKTHAIFLRSTKLQYMLSRVEPRGPMSGWATLYLGMLCSEPPKTR